MVRGSAGIIHSCISRRNCCKTNKHGHSGLDFKKGMSVLFFPPNLFWVFLIGYVLGTERLGDIRPACLFPLVKSKCSLDSWVRRCCKSGHPCMRRVIDCSSVSHKMAWCSVARAIRTVARLGGRGCEIFDISQKRKELASTHVSRAGYAALAVSLEVRLRHVLR